MKLTNTKIYKYSNMLENTFTNKEKVLPVKVGFFLKKNKDILFNLFEEIEKARYEILMRYGKPNEEGTSIEVPSDKIEETNKELNDLLELEQEVNISFIKFSDLEKLELSMKELDAISFMIDEEN